MPTPPRTERGCQRFEPRVLDLVSQFTVCAAKCKRKAAASLWQPLDSRRIFGFFSPALFAGHARRKAAGGLLFGVEGGHLLGLETGRRLGGSKRGSGQLHVELRVGNVPGDDIAVRLG